MSITPVRPPSSPVNSPSGLGGPSKSSLRMRRDVRMKKEEEEETDDDRLKSSNRSLYQALSD